MHTGIRVLLHAVGLLLHFSRQFVRRSVPQRKPGTLLLSFGLSLGSTA